MNMIKKILPIMALVVFIQASACGNPIEKSSDVENQANISAENTKIAEQTGKIVHGIYVVVTTAKCREIGDHGNLYYSLLQNPNNPDEFYVLNRGLIRNGLYEVNAKINGGEIIEIYTLRIVVKE